MATEIERKFLVCGEGWRSLGRGKPYSQGYIPTQNRTTVRLRIAGDQGFITIKSRSVNNTRAEYEYPIPLDDAQEMLATLCAKPIIQKTRYVVPWQGLVWEIDEFAGDNAGLILAEVELATADQAISLPDWIGEEVSHDARYFNSNLVVNPYCNWADP
jgi:adenylate cyclase